MTTGRQLRNIQEMLEKNADKSQGDYFEKIVPGKQKVYGVKTPLLNQLAKEFDQGSFELAEALWKSGALEEKIIAVKIIERTGKSNPARVIKLFRKFATDIDNWAVCDGLGMQFLRGIVKTHAEDIFTLAKQFNTSPDPWQRRLSLVMVEWYTRDPKYHPAIEELVRALENDKEYYVRKAVVWIRRNFVKGR